MSAADYPCKVHTSEGFLTLQLFGVLHNDNLKGYEDVFSQYTTQQAHIAINLEHAVSVSMGWWRWLLKVQTDLKALQKKMCLILVKPQMRNELKKEGLDTAFTICANIRDAQTEFGLIKNKMLDTDFINPFLDATLHVLKVQSQVDAVAGKIFIKNPATKGSGDISGVIGVVSETFNGCVVISFPEKTFLNIISKMLGESYQELTQDIIDGAGEITNMIFGQAKAVLNDKGYGIQMAIPTVISGKDHTIQSMSKGTVISVPFSSNVGGFFVEICISK
ncbi:MAG: chemotaxis protein CheX [Bacteriovoracaceae bacterium]|nr:chemotaxis protein CheX [Bacteriovoracaceae bacterium]